MRRIVIAAMAATLVASSLTLGAPGAAAAPLPFVAPPGMVPPGMALAAQYQTVQYWDPRGYDNGWERRQQWRAWRREQDEARIAEAARREAWRIEQEREQRRAWRHQNGYGPRHGGW
ncbi:hypothetical protein BKE38_16865 [Pseudoroseomonas deserti]|uniref:Uncharacterized protein n=1 Tax=Teichococcus deserti TaxID=1817963 RepID=A0A1V2GZP3_9PROT|nr:hypothetical protein [Pseudoroseomonas deserti]ONG51104.1 hypothetical protein BKE38_16865 [Pseudoroseomonas deserti]